MIGNEKSAFTVTLQHKMLKVETMTMWTFLLVLFGESVSTAKVI